MMMMFQKQIHKVKFYLSADYFTQALRVMLVTNITSVLFFNKTILNLFKILYVYSAAHFADIGKFDCMLSEC